MQMKKLRSVIFFIACLMFNPAFAWFLENGALDQINNGIAAGVTGLNLNYKEIFLSDDVRDNGVMPKSTELGTILGIYFNARKVLFERIYTDLDFDYYCGELKYDGRYQDYPYNPLVHKFEHEFFDADLKAGYIFTFTESNSFQAIPYIGAGYRYWNRQSNNFYDEKYQHYKAIVGLKLNWSLTDDFILSPYVEGGKIFNANMELPYYDLSWVLGKNPIYEAGLEINHKLSNGLFLNGFASYTQFKYGRSAVQSGSFEPDSKTGEIKLGFGIRYS